ncbi:MAG: hypothetical protein C0622_11640 [Desulfuromonas sp.]|nr:MAG: hypothetical protein C0622_11640 [Desulfuromonas sp.]
MTAPDSTINATSLYQPENYTPGSLEDEIRIDGLCRELLQHFLKYLREERQQEPLLAGSNASGADYFLRDYLVDHCRANIFKIQADHVRGFAGNWYIVSTLEANMEELAGLLDGIREFYTFSAARGLVSEKKAAEIAAACGEREYYAARIDSFHELKDNEYLTWNRDCPNR